MTIFEIDDTLAKCYRALGPEGEQLLSTAKIDIFKYFIINRKLQSRCTLIYCRKRSRISSAEEH
jgi:hypothetical protein